MLVILTGCSKPAVPVVLEEEYSFLLTDGELRKIRQSNDTLYEYSGFTGVPRNDTHTWHYKIIDSHKSGELTILKLENLDKIPLKEELCSGKRFTILVLKSLDTNQLRYHTPFGCLTRKQLDTTQISSLPVTDRTFITFFSDSYLKKLAAFRKVSTWADVKEIINAIEGNNADAGRISYSAEELSKACIEKRYDPAGAGLRIDSIVKRNRQVKSR